ncbi:helicase [Fragilaria crotonensis]|nr:helicase [Fragilaria crotonensis]
MLTVVKGATSFEALRTVDDVLCPTFQDACRTLGLLDDDTEWHRAMQEATQTLSPARLRRLFAIILFNCDVSDPRSLYDSHWAALSEDYAHRQPSLSEQHLQDLLVRKLDALLGIMHSRSVFEWIPSLRTLLVEEHGSAMDNNSVNHLLELQLSSSNTDIQQQLDRLPLLNLEQRAIFDAVLASVNNNAGTENQKMFILLMDLQAQSVLQCLIPTTAEIVDIPRIALLSPQDELPFVFKRRQFPVQPAYAMTINKSQGQTLRRVGIFLPQGVFAHGQLYVALSRVRNPHDLFIFTDGHLLHNIVYKEVLISNCALSIINRICKQLQYCVFWQSKLANFYEFVTFFLI